MELSEILESFESQERFSITKQLKLQRNKRI